MNEADLLHFIVRDIKVFPKFISIFSIDELNFHLPSRESFIICNTDESFRKGKHWIVKYLNNKK